MSLINNILLTLKYLYVRIDVRLFCDWFLKFQVCLLKIKNPNKLTKGQKILDSYKHQKISYNPQFFFLFRKLLLHVSDAGSSRNFWNTVCLLVMTAVLAQRQALTMGVCFAWKALTLHLDRMPVFCKTVLMVA